MKMRILYNEILKYKPSGKCHLISGWYYLKLKQVWTQVIRSIMISVTKKMKINNDYNDT